LGSLDTTFHRVVRILVTGIGGTKIYSNLGFIGHNFSQGGEDLGDRKWGILVVDGGGAQN